MNYTVPSVVVLFLSTCLSRPEERKEPDSVTAILQKVTQFELYSLEPLKGRAGWKELGKTTVKDAETRKKLVAALDQSIANAKDSYKCFRPRHLIRVVDEGQIVDFVICFECGWLYVYRGKDTEPRRIIVAEEAPPVYNRVLRDAGIPLAE